MPPRIYPKLPGEAGAAVRRVRRGYVPLPQLGATLNGVRSIFERSVLKVAYYCALRASEVGLQPVEHFDSERGTLDIVRLKGSLPHTYQLEPWVADDVQLWLKQRPRASPYLFPHPEDARFPLDRFNVYRYWKRAAKRAGLPKELHHPHVLKHSVATHMLDRGNDILFVQEWLGHKKLENTQVYAELTGKRLQAGQGIVQGLVAALEGQKHGH